MVKFWISALLLCLLGVPLIIYATGGLIVGPYEGEGGITGLMSAIYGDALTGHLTAILLLFSPLLLIGIWYGVIRWKRALEAPVAPQTGG